MALLQDVSHNYHTDIILNAMHQYIKALFEKWKLINIWEKFHFGENINSQFFRLFKKVPLRSIYIK